MSQERIVETRKVVIEKDSAGNIDKHVSTSSSSSSGLGLGLQDKSNVDVSTSFSHPATNVEFKTNEVKVGDTSSSVHGQSLLDKLSNAKDQMMDKASEWATRIGKDKDVAVEKMRTGVDLAKENSMGLMEHLKGSSNVKSHMGETYKSDLDVRTSGIQSGNSSFPIASDTLGKTTTNSSGINLLGSSSISSSSSIPSSSSIMSSSSNLNKNDNFLVNASSNFEASNLGNDFGSVNVGIPSLPVPGVDNVSVQSSSVGSGLGVSTSDKIASKASEISEKASWKLDQASDKLSNTAQDVNMSVKSGVGSLESKIGDAMISKGADLKADAVKKQSDINIQ